MILVPDASAAVEILLRTEVGRRAEDVLAEGTLVAPEILDAEVLAAMRRQVLRGRLTARRAQDALEVLRIWNIERVSHRELIAAAFQLRDFVSAYDALYVAVAVGWHGEIVTADRHLARAGLPVAVRNVSP